MGPGNALTLAVTRSSGSASSATYERPRATRAATSVLLPDDGAPLTRTAASPRAAQPAWRTRSLSAAATARRLMSHRSQSRAPAQSADDTEYLPSQPTSSRPSSVRRTAYHPLGSRSVVRAAND